MRCFHLQSFSWLFCRTLAEVVCDLSASRT
uniref:Uncharacterized protein n=1 Tax=Anguilla anguilla TaxID=7936 RepID=A0A0E9QI97_ANGAN